MHQIDSTKSMSFSVKYSIICLSFFHLFAFGLKAQVSIRDSAIRMATINLAYRGSVAGGAWTERWNFVSNVGIDLGVKFKSNIYLQGGASFLFTDRTQDEGGLDELLRGTGGLIITDEGFLSEVSISGRGFIVPVSLGYIFPVLGPNPNSGIYAEIGGQFAMHRFNYRVVDGESSALEGEYAKGYDRMRYGIGLREGLGYVYYDNKNQVNFAIGLDFAQVPTRSGRQVFFPTGPLDTNETTLDFFWGIKASWIYTIYKRAPSEAYFY
ncbi:MAG: hypothetical protein MRZ79_02015 [Bacteroidia bacterium]|nr:hypothetical protein [Bacteroidia bacterium]